MPLAAIVIVIAAGIIFKQQPSQQNRRHPSVPADAHRSPPSRNSDFTISGLATVVDGDTIIVARVQVRLFGIDAPENDQPCRLRSQTWACGSTSATQLRNLIGDSTVRCAPTGKDRYDRTLARCHVGETDIQSWMVANGWAVAYSRYSRNYEPEQQRAQEHRLGIWQGDMVLPEEWRRATQRR